MSKKNDTLEGFDYPDLQFSDQQRSHKAQDENQPTGQPVKKTKIDQSIPKPNEAQNNQNIPKSQSNQSFSQKGQMAFFPPPPPGSQGKSNNEWVPPPPVIQRQNYNQRPQQTYKKFNQSKDVNKEKRNTIYVKNIPKLFNTQEKLMTFFKNEGGIKQIKVNEQEQSAVIKFMKDQNAAKFLKSNKIIFNRSYIVYGEEQNLTVTQQQINDRINEEQGSVKKAEKTNLKVVKEKIYNQLSENIRALYFLQNYLIEQGQQSKIFREQIDREIQAKILAKKQIEEQNDNQFKPESYQTVNYNWTVNFIRKSNSGYDKKGLFAEFLKYGPIISLDVECISDKQLAFQNKNKVQEGQQPQRVFLDYQVSVQFLSPKHAWQLYSLKKDEMGLSIQGKQLSKLFESGKLRQIQTKKTNQADAPAQVFAEQQNQQIQTLTQNINANDSKPQNQDETQKVEV